MLRKLQIQLQGFKRLRMETRILNDNFVVWCLFWLWHLSSKKGYIRGATGSAILPGMEGSDVHLHVLKPTNWAMCRCKKLHW